MKNWSNKNHEKALERRREKERVKKFQLNSPKPIPTTVTLDAAQLDSMSTVTIDGVQVRYNKEMIVI